MESRVIKINPARKEFPYFAQDRYTGAIWLVKSKVRRAYVRAFFVSGNTGYIPFEYECDMRASKFVKIERMKLSIQIGDIKDA